jgi:hypothetical protein
MYCYWSGEVILGNLNGVMSTTAGHLNQEEVVLVEYDQTIISEKSFHSLDGMKVIPTDLKKFTKCETDQKYYLQHSFPNWKKTLSTYQATKVNAALKSEKNWEIYSSFKQIQFLKNK